MRRITASLVLFVAVLFCAACGGGPEDTNVTTNGTPNSNTNTTTTNGDVNVNGTPKNTNTTTTNGDGRNMNGNLPRNGNTNTFPFNANTSNVNASPSPVPNETDKITVTYPNLLLQNDTDDERGQVIFTLDRVKGLVDPSTNTNGKTTTTQNRADNISGARPGTFAPADNAEDFDVYVEVKLEPGEQSIRAEELTPAERHYTGQKEEVWKWKLRHSPEVRTGDPFSFQFKVNLRWKRKGTNESGIPRNDVWKNLYTSRIGPTATRVNAALYGSPLFAAGGFITIATSRRRRKDSEVAETAEEDGIEEQPETAATKAMPMTEAKWAEPEEAVEDEVSGTVYAPGQAAPGDGFLVQVFIHLPEQAEALEELAREADPDARRRISNELQKKIKRGTELTFHLQLPGLGVDDDVQSCVWEGRPECVQFGVTVPEDCKPKNILGTVTVSEASVPIGHLRFKFKITDAAAVAPAAPAEPVPAGNLTRYQQAFISYASKDRQEVLKRVQMLNVAKVKFFQDLLTLEPGDEWEKLLYEYIDKSDVFFLFWSTAASESKWVKKEVEYAIKRRANKDEPDPEIIPVIIEGPPPAKPPAELSSIHFNDKLIYFINTRETGSQPGQQEEG
jgi:hypothetical protein